MTNIRTAFMNRASAAAIVFTMSTTVAFGTTPGTPARTDQTTGLAGAFLAAGHANAIADSDKASTYYNKALAIDPSNTSFLSGAYASAAASGNIETAIAAAQRYNASGAPVRTLSNMLIASGHIKAKEYDKAWALIDAIPKDGPLSFMLPVARAWTKAAQNNADEAVSELAPLEKMQGLSDLHLLISAQLNESIGRTADAITAYDKLAETISRRPVNDARMIILGYHRLGQSAKAKSAADKFRTGRGGFFEFEQMTTALMTPTRVGQRLTAQEGFADGLFAFSQALAGVEARQIGDFSISFGHLAMYLSPDIPFGHWLLGSVLGARGRTDDAKDMLLKVRKNDPSYLAAQMQIVELLQSEQKHGDALGRLQTLALEYPKKADIQAGIANILRFDQKFAEAIVAYTKAIQISDANSRESWPLFYGRGIAYERSKQWKLAEADFQKALKLNPDQPDVLNYLGYSWIDRGENFEEARRLIELAYSKSPNSGYITDSLGWAMYLMGDYKGAVTYLEKAVDLEPGDATLNDHLGDAYYKVGRTREARFQWERALTLKPEEKQRTEIKLKLEQGLPKK